MKQEKETRCLIERLMSGDITPAEQRQLKTLLNAADLAPEFAVYRNMMEWMDRPLPVPTDEELRGMGKVETPRRTLRRWAVAVSIAIMLGSVGWMRMRKPATEPQGTVRVLATEPQGTERQVAKHCGAATTPSVTPPPHAAERSVGTEPTAEEISVRPGVRLNQPELQDLAPTDIPVIAEPPAEISPTEEIGDQGTPTLMTVDEIIYNMEVEERAERFRQRMACPTPELITELIYLAITNE